MPVVATRAGSNRSAFLAKLNINFSLWTLVAPVFGLQKAKRSSSVGSIDNHWKATGICSAAAVYLHAAEQQGIVAAEQSMGGAALKNRTGKPPCALSLELPEAAVPTACTFRRAATLGPLLCRPTACETLRAQMQHRLFRSKEELHAWLEQQQAGYGGRAKSLWDRGGRSVAAIRIAPCNELEQLGFLRLEARHLQRLILQGVRRFSRKLE